MIVRAETTDDTVLALFSSADQADAASRELRAIGFDHDDFGIADAEDQHCRLLDNASRSMVSALVRGALTGAPVGIAAAIGIDWLTSAGILVNGMTEVIVFALLGSLWGSIIGAHLELTAEIHRVDEAHQLNHRPLQGEEVLVTVADVGSRGAEVEKIIERNGGWRTAGTPA